MVAAVPGHPWPCVQRWHRCRRQYNQRIPKRTHADGGMSLLPHAERPSRPSPRQPRTRTRPRPPACTRRRPCARSTQHAARRSGDGEGVRATFAVRRPHDSTHGMRNAARLRTRRCVAAWVGRLRCGSVEGASARLWAGPTANRFLGLQPQNAISPAHWAPARRPFCA
jgi:hypothetical protein